MTDQPFVIRRATSGDAAAILECLRAAFAPYEDAYTPAAFADTVLSAATIGRRLGEMTVLVAERRPSGGALAGTIGGQTAGREGHVRGMAVDPACQGTGVGHALLAAVERELAAAGCARITLDTTSPLARAIAFYERHGYQATGVVRDFFGMSLFEYKREL